MNKKTIFQFFAMIIFTLSISCTDNLKPGWAYQVDNPLDKDISIKVDNNEYTIPANSMKTITISQGKHTLTYNGNSVNFVTKVNSNKYVTIMNPTLSNYMLHAHFYVRKDASNNSIEDLYNKYSHEYQSGDVVVKLPVEVLNGLFIEKEHHGWVFGLHEEAKEEIGARQGSKKVYTKLYRENDYIKEFAKEWPAGWAKFPVNSKPLSEQPAYIFPTEYLISDCNALNEKIKEYEDKWNKIIADPSDIFQEVAKLSSNATNNVISEFSEIYSKCSAGQNGAAFREVKDRLDEEMNYLTYASTFIIE